MCIDLVYVYLHLFLFQMLISKLEKTKNAEEKANIKKVLNLYFLF